MCGTLYTLLTAQLQSSRKLISKTLEATRIFLGLVKAA